MTLSTHITPPSGHFLAIATRMPTKRDMASVARRVTRIVNESKERGTAFAVTAGDFPSVRVMAQMAGRLLGDLAMLFRVSNQRAQRPGALDPSFGRSIEAVVCDNPRAHR